MPNRAAYLLSLCIAGILEVVTLIAAEAQPKGSSNSTSVIDLSRDSAVEIRSGDRRLGTGFLISDHHVATAFHVIAETESTAKGVNISYSADLSIRLLGGEVIGAECVTLATDADPAPYKYDFAVLRLSRSPKSPHKAIKLADAREKPSVGQEILFSGYPLDTPGMVTHKGMVSGSDDSSNIIFLQTAINKGNSGGVVLTADGKPVGIISLREGGISKGLQDVQQRIKKMEEAKDVRTTIRMGAVDPIQSTRDIIATLDKYISTGIGYAISIKFLKIQLATHPEVLKK